MERGSRLGVAFLFLSIFAAGIAAEQFKVGDDEGWREPNPGHADVYALWAGKINFNSGDSLYFEYTNDSVVVVDKRGYYHCDTTNATTTFNDGKTVIRLDAAGLVYFISGVPGHCAAGQRLIVDVSPVLPRDAPAPSPSPAAPSPSSPPPELPSVAVPPAGLSLPPHPNSAGVPSAARIPGLVLLALIFL
ncbi:mavicyanin-like [Wolffia australiana]